MPPVLVYPAAVIPPHTIIFVPVQIAVWFLRAYGASGPELSVAVQVSTTMTGHSDGVTGGVGGESADSTGPLTARILKIWPMPGVTVSSFSDRSFAGGDAIRSHCWVWSF